MINLDSIPSTGFIVGMSISIGILLILSFFFSGSETAVTVVKPYQWESYCGQNVTTKSKVVNKMLNQYSITLGAVLIGNTACNIIAPSLLTFLITTTLGNFAVGASTGILTFFVLLFCEYFPKSIARKHPIGWLNLFYIPMFCVWIIFWPFCVLFNFIFEKNKKATATERDIGFLIKTVQTEGILEQSEADLVKKAMLFDDTKIEKIMVADVVYISENNTFGDVIEKFINSNYSRLPVINEKNGKVIGFILSKEILRSFYYAKNPNEKVNIKDFVKKIYCITKDMMLDDALKIVQRTNTHILAVVDSLNNKKMIGIVTMEMLLEQLVGQIYDEKDTIKKIQVINDFTWVVNASVSANFFMKKFFDINVQNEKTTMDAYLKKIFKVKELKINDLFENQILSVSVINYGEGNEICFEVIKK